MPGLVRLNLALSADGYIAGPKGEIDWLVPYPGELFGIEQFLSSITSIVMGRTSYDDLRRMGAWPYSEKLVFVLTSRPLPEPPKGVEQWPFGVAALAEKSRTFGDVWLFGGAKTVRAFANEGLIDRYELYIVPELLGDGMRLFEPGLKREGLRLIEAQPFTEGVVALIYAKR